MPAGSPPQSGTELHPVGPPGAPFPPALADGNAWLAPLVRQPVPAMTVTVARATFEAGGATRWHRHEGPQLLVFVEGAGFVETEDSGRFEAGAGDTVWCPAGVWHRHGARSSASATHVSTTWGDTEWRS